ncbi:MAG TPA: PqqD family protein [Caldilineaceae bacterium]|nr:PqqD family protein [Caldilineaceae bacterium]
MISSEERISLALHSVVVASNEQISAHLGEEVVILGFKHGSYYSLDQVGLFVWNLLQEPHAVADICNAILEEYEVEFERCKQDLFALLTELSAVQLIEIHDENGRS